MKISEAVNTLLDLHNPSDDTQSYSKTIMIVNYY